MSFYERVWEVVRRVPRGKVVTYGQVATWLGSPRAARAVGYAMFNAPDDPNNVRKAVPWHRVINSKGEISEGGAPHRALLQRQLLEAEGVVLDATGRVDLRIWGWKPQWEALHITSAIG